MTTEPGQPPRTGAADRPAVELLVHGVGGATPADMLGDARTVRVTGDHTAAVYRRGDDAEDRPWDERAPLREAYSWSNLTSGNGARALWLLLLPFMIANIAHWMRPATRGHGRTHRAYDALLRLIALSLTVLLVSAACAVVMDLVAWQCAAATACTDRAGWLGFLADGGWWSQPGRRLALAALLPAALAGLLYWLSHRTWSAYESAYPPVRERPDAGEGAVLSLPGFWFGRRVGSRLRAAHTAAALLTVCAALLAATWSADHGPDGSAGRAAAAWTLTALLAVGAVAAVTLTTRPGRTEMEPEDRTSRLAATVLPLAAGGLLLLTMAYALWDRPTWEATGAHPGATVFLLLPVLQGVLIAGLAAAAFRLHGRAATTDRVALRGLGGPAVAVLACALAGLMTGGAAQRLADWLEPGDGVADDTALAGPHVVLTWQAAVIPAMLVVLLAFVVGAAFRVRALRRRLAPEIPERYPDEAPPDGGPTGRVAAAIARARLTDGAPLLVGSLAVTSVLLGLVAVGGALLTGEVPRDALADTAWPLAGAASVAQSLGSWVLSFGILALLVTGRRAYLDAGARRTVGILWDVGTFWPRAAHPFAPPCYAERAVPDLSWRIATWVESTGGRVVLSGHSQGSVLAAAALWQLDGPTRGQVALLTHGSPLARLYGRWFPKYFGSLALDGLHRDVPHWRNLWRDTDPIGGPVRVAGEGEPVDRAPLPDPRHLGRNLVSPLPDPLLGHGEYTTDPAYAEERGRLCAGLVGRRPEVPGQLAGRADG